jgi:hypothetical protein
VQWGSCLTPVRAGVRGQGQRVATHQGGLAGAGNPQRQVLAGPGGRQDASVRRGQVDRRDGGGFGYNVGHAQRPEPGPGWPGTGCRFGTEGRGGGAVAFGGQQVANEACQPGLSAGICVARRSFAVSRPGQSDTNGHGGEQRAVLVYRLAAAGGVPLGGDWLVR